MRLSVIGCGYLGAVHAAAMASIGHEVVGIDVDARKIDALSRGEAPFFEPGLQEILTAGIESGNLTFTTDPSAAKGAKVHFIGVGTPQQTGGYAADLTFVNAAVDGLLPHLSEGDVVAGKSTVPVGTAAGLAPRVEETGATLVWNPEFLREGWAVHDTIDPDRLVAGVPAGAEGGRAADILREVYHPSVAKNTPFLVTDLATAELVKVAANAFLATKISFINAMAETSPSSPTRSVTTPASAAAFSARASASAAAASRRTSGRSRPGPKSSAGASRSPSSAKSTRSICVGETVPSNSSSRRSADRCSRRTSPCSAPRSSPTATTSATPPRSTSRCACTVSEPGSRSPTPPRSRTRAASTRSSTTSTIATRRFAEPMP